MRILALEPFYGGSHQAFLDGWQAHSSHEFTVLGLPAYKWKWRMRHAAVTFASQLNDELREQSWDAVWCSDMLNLAEFLGLVRQEIQALPRVVYFHENQLTYPVRHEKARDLHFAYSNFTTALAADQVWFNSQFHLDEFLNALRKYLSRMPDYQSAESVDAIAAKSSVQYPGVKFAAHQRDPSSRKKQPTTICWNARWEHDKNPDDFFDALRILKSNGTDFRLIVLGESFQNSPQIFASAETEFADQIDHFGYAETMDKYWRLLSLADVVVSTAKHEFFGIGIVEAVTAGVIPCLPNRLAYPEVLAALGFENPDDFLYNGGAEQLAARLASLCNAKPDGRNSTEVESTNRFDLRIRARQMDEVMTLLISE